MTIEKNLTIGMPVYNGEKYLEEALNSLLSVTIPFRLIISDNNSSDYTYSILKKYENKFDDITIIRQKNNIGAVENFLFLLELSTTRYFSWLGADDMVGSGWFERNLEVLQNDDRIIASIGGINLIEADGSLSIQRQRVEDLTFNKSRLLRRMKFFSQPNELGRANLIYSVWNTEVLELGDFSSFRSNYYAADSLFVYNLLMYGRIVQNHDAVLYKRIHSGAESSQDDIPQLTLVKVFMQLFIHPGFAQFLNKSSGVEKIILPFGYLLSVIMSIKYSVKRMLDK